MSTVSAGSGATLPSVRPIASMRPPGVPASSATVDSVNAVLAAVTGDERLLGDRLHLRP